jgi:hypothetical protein
MLIKMKPIVLAILGGAAIIWLFASEIKNETVVYPAAQYHHADTSAQAGKSFPAYSTGIATGTEDQYPVNNDHTQTGSSKIATAGQWGLVSSILLILSFTPGGDELYSRPQ